MTAILAFAVFAFGVAIAEGRIGFDYRDYFASRYPGVSLAWSLTVVTVAVMLHEFWHLAAARVAGMPATITLSTRLIFLTAQTAAPLMWLASRRQRLSFYLAGMTSDLGLASASALVTAGCGTGTWPSAMGGSACLMLLLGLGFEFAFCLRTDIYLVVQEPLRCRNLFEDAQAYARYQASRAVRRLRWSKAGRASHTMPADPKSCHDPRLPRLPDHTR
jgi:putative peptide zinc metalloprotease protein